MLYMWRGLPGFNQVLYVHQKKCVVCISSSPLFFKNSGYLQCVIKCYLFTRRSMLYMCGVGTMFNQVLYVHKGKCCVCVCVYLCVCVFVCVFVRGGYHV